SLHSASSRSDPLRAALDPSRSPYPAPARSFPSLPLSGRRSRRGVAELPNRRLRGCPLAACARVEGTPLCGACSVELASRRLGRARGSSACLGSSLLSPPPPPPPRALRSAIPDPTPFGSARAPQARLGRRDGRMSGGRRKEEPPQPQLANGALKVSVWSKVLRSDAAWDDKDEFLDVIYWFRQIIAVVLGVIWGILPLRGFLGIAGFCLINAGVLYLYFSNYLQIDEEEYGGTWELTKEGFMTSFALFMVIWIIFYTAIHYD
ncbi:Respirasome Complex Assembly Factor 1, partial [Lemmus lemmus]